MYIFNPGGSVQNHDGGELGTRPLKKRKVSRKAGPRSQQQQQQQSTRPPGPEFIPLFNGAEKAGAVRLRKELFETAWPILEGRIQVSQMQTGIVSCCRVLLRHASV